MNVRSGVRGVVHEQRAWGLFGVKEVKTPLFVSSCFSLVFSVLVRRRERERTIVRGGRDVVEKSANLTQQKLCWGG